MNRLLAAGSLVEARRRQGVYGLLLLVITFAGFVAGFAVGLFVGLLAYG